MGLCIHGSPPRRDKFGGIMKENLENWGKLNEFLKVATEEQCEKLLLMEKLGAQRLQFKLRIYGKLNKLRTTRERNELAGAKK